MSRSLETLDMVIRGPADATLLSAKSLTARPAGPTTARIASLVMEASAESVEETRPAASLGREATLTMEESMSSSSSRVGGWMLSRLEWQEEREERSSAEVAAREPPSARRTASGTAEPSLAEREWRHWRAGERGSSGTLGRRGAGGGAREREGRESSIREGGWVSAIREGGPCASEQESEREKARATSPASERPDCVREGRPREETRDWVRVASISSSATRLGSSSFTSITSLTSWLEGRERGLSLSSGMATPGTILEPRGDLLPLRPLRLAALRSLASPPPAGDLDLDFLDLPARSKCSDLDLGMAELMQSASRSSSSWPVLSRLSTEREEREELKPLDSAARAGSAASEAPVEEPELPDLGRRVRSGRPDPAPPSGRINRALGRPPSLSRVTTFN
jgi:hypothetical protein